MKVFDILRLLKSSSSVFKKKKFIKMNLDWCKKQNKKKNTTDVKS